MNDMLLLGTILLGAFIFSAAMSTEDINDDDDNNGPGGGMMIPMTVPTS